LLVAASAENSALHPIGTLYGAWAFNFMVDVASAISHDFIDRPHQYQKVPSELSDIMIGFRSSMGSHPDWPDAQQRLAHFRVLGTASTASAPLREAAIIYVEDGTDGNRDLLTDAFRDAAGSFRTQIQTVEGQALNVASRQISSIFNNAIQIFQSNEVMGAFGLSPASKNENWPFAGPPSGDGSYLAAELVRALDAGTIVRTLLSGPKRDADGAPKPKPIRISMTQNKFILLQQAAWYGASAMSATMTEDHFQDKPVALIGNAYKWAKALQKLVPDVVRVWKDPNHRLRLTDLEWGMVSPHPVEAISLSVAASPAFGIGYSTATVRGEVCCSTGDLVCASSTNCEESPRGGTCGALCGTWDCGSAWCVEA
jgi:hypothetical protein